MLDPTLQFHLCQHEFSSIGLHIGMWNYQVLTLAWFPTEVGMDMLPWLGSEAVSGNLFNIERVITKWEPRN